MILWDDILAKIEGCLQPEDDLRFIDLRYLEKWQRKYPQCFPAFMLANQHQIKFNPEKLRYEIWKN